VMSTLIVAPLSESDSVVIATPPAGSVKVCPTGKPLPVPGRRAGGVHVEDPRVLASRVAARRLRVEVEVRRRVDEDARLHARVESDRSPHLDRVVGELRVARAAASSARVRERAYVGHGNGEDLDAVAGLLGGKEVERAALL